MERPVIHCSLRRRLGCWLNFHYVIIRNQAVGGMAVWQRFELSGRFIAFDGPFSTSTCHIWHMTGQRLSNIWHQSIYPLTTHTDMKLRPLLLLHTHTHTHADTHMQTHTRRHTHAHIRPTFQIRCNKLPNYRPRLYFSRCVYSNNVSVTDLTVTN